MNAHFMPFSKIISIDQGAREHYHVPKYQREDSWGKRDWERLLQDIDENDPGYFMGSIICVKDGEGDSPGAEIIYEVIDGQQRLTTLSLYMMAIYARLKQLEGALEFEDDEDRLEFETALQSLRNKLVKKKKEGHYSASERGGWVEQSKMLFLRVQPSSQNSNLDDYTYLLSEIGLIRKRTKPRYHGVRSICKAYRFFLETLPEDIEELLQIVGKINELSFVHITVGSQADAFTLFETLNNRGVPLSAIDIIKNKMLAEMERQHQVDIDSSYEQWQDLVAAIPDPTDQERFLRHFYHAFRWDDAIRVDGIPRAVKSKLIMVYETLIKRNAESMFGRLCGAADAYGTLIDPGDEDWDSETRSHLIDLSRIGAAPAYQVLLYLFTIPLKTYALPGDRSRALDLLARYYVRRNVTDFPGTKRLDQDHIELIAACQAHIDEHGRLPFAFIRDRLLLKGQYATLQELEEKLRGPMYSTNSLITRYLLALIDEKHHTREYTPDLWARNDKGQFVWTIEHVLPQSEQIPAEWVQMIAGGDLEQAKQLHEAHVHRLGNLTLSGYNSRLATASFDRKQSLSEDRKFLGHTINIGYKNRLALNQMEFKGGAGATSLADTPVWTADLIEARTKRMVELLLDLLRFREID